MNKINIKVNHETVVWLYRSILGREPESEDVINRKVANFDNFDKLRLDFLKSDEFQKIAVLHQPPIKRFPIKHKKNNIEHIASDNDLERCLGNIREAWSSMGRDIPHYSVLTSDIFLPSNIERNADIFWQSGAIEAEEIHSILKRFDFDFKNKVAIEYGCGVGRVSTPLSKLFKILYAYDISTYHLDIAKKHSLEQGAKNIIYCEVGNNKSIYKQRCHFFYSRIVFQHNPPPLIAMLVEGALASLHNNGIAIFQVPVYKVGYNFKLNEWLNTKHSNEMQMHCLPQSVIFSIIKKQNCQLLELREDESCGEPFLSNLFVVKKTSNFFTNFFDFLYKSKIS